ncbi:hypothetical protein ACLOJK_028870 [Asimina triloba]
MAALAGQLVHIDVVAQTLPLLRFVDHWLVGAILDEGGILLILDEGGILLFKRCAILLGVATPDEVRKGAD